MDGEGTDNGIENEGYFEDEYSDVPWADNIDKHELTGTECNHNAVLERHDDHVNANNIDVVSQHGADDCAGVSHHVFSNSQKHDQEFTDNSAITNSSNEATHGESITGATYYNNPLMDIVRHVAKGSDSEGTTTSEMDSKQRKGLDNANKTETETVTNGLSEVVSTVDSKKTSWITRFSIDPVFRTNVLESIAVQYVIFTLGWIYTMMGPSLPDLQIISGMGLQEASWIFTGFAIGYMIGCAASGVLIARFSARTQLVLCGIAAAVAVEILPLIPNGYVMVAMRIVGGIAAGGQNTSLTVRLFEIWGSTAGPWVQMLYCIFSIAGIISPLVIKPFLAQTLTSNTGENSINGTGIDVTQTEFENSSFHMTYTSTVSTLYMVNSTVDQLLKTSSTAAPTIGKSNIHYAFLISALLSVLTAVPFIIYYLKDRKRIKTRELSEKTSAVDTHTNSKILTNKWKYTLLALMCLSSLIGTGYIDTLPNYLTSFGILQLGATAEDGSFATSIYFAMKAVGNLVGVIMLRHMSSGKYFTIAHILTSVSLALYYISIRLSLTKPLQWTFIAMNGFAVSAILPTMFAWTQDNVTPVSGRVTSAYLVSGSLGFMVTPLFLGYLMENVTPMWFVYTLCLYEGGCIVLFVVATIVVMYCRRQKVGTHWSSSENNNQMNPAFKSDLNEVEDKIH